MEILIHWQKTGLQKSSMQEEDLWNFLAPKMAAPSRHPSRSLHQRNDQPTISPSAASGGKRRKSALSPVSTQSTFWRPWLEFVSPWKRRTGFVATWKDSDH